MEAPRRAAQPSSRTRAVLLILLAAATLCGAVLGPRRGLRWSLDFVSQYCAARAWMSHENPFDNKALVHIWTQQSGRRDIAPLEGRTPMIYPPGSQLMVMPVALLDWNIAKVVWMSLLGVSFVVFLWIALKTVRLTWENAVLFLSWMMLFGPFRWAFRVAQPSLASLGIGIAGWRMALARREWIGGLLSGIAFVLKPTLAVPFVAHLILQGRWRATVVTALLSIASLALFVTRLERDNIHWFATWTNGLRAVERPGGINDTSLSNPARYQLIHSEAFLRPILQGKMAAKATGLAMSLALGAVYLVLEIRGRRAVRAAWHANRHASSENNGHNGEYDASTSYESSPTFLTWSWLSVSTLATISLMPVYHRNYDAVLLAMPLIWAFWAVHSSNLKHVGWLLMLLVLPYSGILPFYLLRLDALTFIPASLTQSWWWQPVVIAHQSWLIPVIAIVLLYAMLRQGTATTTDPTLAESLPHRVETHAEDTVGAEVEAEAEVEEEAEAVAREHGIFPAS